MEVAECTLTPLSSTERSRIHRARASAIVIEQRRRLERIRAQQTRAAETEQEKTVRRAKDAERHRRVRSNRKKDADD